MRQLMLALACFLLLIIPSANSFAPPPGISQDDWDDLEGWAHKETKAQNPEIKARLELHKRLVDGLLN